MIPSPTSIMNGTIETFEKGFDPFQPVIKGP
jgi:hypothetical protein